MKTNPSQTLPPIVKCYFEASNRHDAAGVAECFTADAVVDEQFGNHRGHHAIRAWIEDISRQFQPSLLILAAKPSLADLTLTVSVAGRFPGSPVQLDFHFHLRAGKIGSLVIE